MELTENQLQAQLTGATWPPTADLFPPGNLNLDETWRSFYKERIQVGLVSLYPRTLTAPPLSLNCPGSQVCPIPWWS